ncbi:MAG TPA: amidohydrolase family protein, partial [Verrucomicrobiae bacterium]|nr:amidohydrolase family protein [Verrucomicrobiae bacterium]
MNSLMLKNAKILDNWGNKIGSSLWCAGDKIVGIDMDSVPNGAKVLDAAGGYVIPAFEDAHVHLLQYGAQLNHIGLVEAKTLQETLAMIKVGAQAQAGEWILGGEWDKNNWDVPSFPSRTDLDLVTGSRPCAIYGRDLHSLWVNSEALRRMNITAETPDPPGGFIVRDDEGQPTGILLERAMGILGAALPGWTVKNAE